MDERDTHLGRIAREDKVEQIGDALGFVQAQLACRAVIEWLGPAPHDTSLKRPRTYFTVATLCSTFTCEAGRIYDLVDRAARWHKADLTWSMYLESMLDKVQSVWKQTIMKGGLPPRARLCSKAQEP